MIGEAGDLLNRDGSARDRGQRGADVGGEAIPLQSSARCGEVKGDVMVPAPEFFISPVLIWGSNLRMANAMPSSGWEGVLT